MGDQAKLLLEGKSKEPGFLPVAIARPTALNGGFRGSRLVDRWNGEDVVKFETMDPTDDLRDEEYGQGPMWVARMNSARSSRSWRTRSS